MSRDSHNHSSCDSSCFPAVSRLRKYPLSDEYFTFEIQRFLPDRQPNRLLYIAETSELDAEERLVVIKFSRQYSIELHGLHRERWKAELQTLMDEFHHNNLVHGDLRCPNIVCEGESVMLLDFDRGGRDGVVSYPTWKLNGELSVGRVSEDLKITKDDDRRLLENTLNSLGVSYVASHPIYSGFIKISRSLFNIWGHIFGRI